MRDFDTEHYYINLDLKPALDEEKLDRRLLRDFEENANRGNFVQREKYAEDY